VSRAPATWKGFDLAELGRRFGVRLVGAACLVPYLTEAGDVYREKLFPIAVTASGCRTTWLGPSKPQIPYGLETLRLGGEVAFLTEGESDCWALRLAFEETPVLGVPGASAWQTEWAELLDSVEVVYLSFDGDDAGRRLADRVWADLGRKARWVRMLRGLDTRDVLQRYGAHVFEAMLRDADYGHELGVAFDARAEAIGP
jgi:hypothetical protein